ncbi:MAG: MFS transporter, partial [Lacunisphaera sp.]|nr:MFS transporter [Lacunisphaera sp.]
VTPLLRNRNFLWFWAGEGISQLGAQFTGLALPVLAVTLLGASEWEVGVLGAAQTAAFLVVGLPAGAWIDRMLKRRVMIVADLVRAVTLALVPILWFAGSLEIWHLYLVGAIVGVATVFFDVSYQSFVPVLLPGEQVGSANSKLEATSQIAHIGGPGLAGALLTVVSAPVLLLADGVSYLVSAFALWRVRDTEKLSDPASRQPLHREIAEGLRFVFGHPLLRRITATTGTSNFFGTLVFTLQAILILRILDLGPAALGVIFGVGSVGGLLGALAAPWIQKRVGEGTAVSLSALAMGLGVLALPLATVFPAAALPILIAGSFVESFLVLVYNITQVTMRQRLTPPRLLGRMNASIRFVVWGVMPIAALLSGVLGGTLGVVPTMWIGTVGTFLAAGFVLFSPITRLRVLPTELVESGHPETGAESPAKVATDVENAGDVGPRDPLV